MALFQRLVEQAPENERALYSGFLDFADKHKAIIDGFGRYPYRNSVLGRECSPKELAFLSQPGSSF